jgi:hypothetical protein
MDGMREIVAVVVAAGSPAGQLARALDDLAAHLPPSEQQWGCALCCSESWPCSRFHAAAQQIIAARLRLDEFVPLDLHPRLWPPTPPAQSQLAPPPDDWFDEESRNG